MRMVVDYTGVVGHILIVMRVKRKRWGVGMDKNIILYFETSDKTYETDWTLKEVVRELSRYNIVHCNDVAGEFSGELCEILYGIVLEHAKNHNIDIGDCVKVILKND